MVGVTEILDVLAPVLHNIIVDPEVVTERVCALPEQIELLNGDKVNVGATVFCEILCDPLTVHPLAVFVTV